jgi:hypothetical protein
MQPVELARNPFALLLNPEAVMAEIDRSGRLGRLKSRICRPLDKSSGPLEAEASADGGVPADEPGADPIA